MQRERRMLLMVLILLIPLAMVQTPPVAAQRYVRHEIRIPDIPGFRTLKCDFHSHTVFSDGSVWPDFRIWEAWRGGLDVLAITDHIEYLPHKENLPPNFDRSYELALPAAQDLGILLVRSVEITRDMPPGHFNALFVWEGSRLDVPDWRDALKEAITQQAFIFWNHPGWKQPGEIPVWYPEHSEILKLGGMHGIEIVNYTSHYPLAFQWGLEKNLTLLGNSDTHDPISADFDSKEGSSRPLTLVFARERSLEAVKESLFARQTAVYWNDRLMGDERFLKPILEASVKLLKTSVQITGRQQVLLPFQNSSDLPIRLVPEAAPEEISLGNRCTLFPNAITLLPISGKKKETAGSKELVLRFKVENMLTSPDSPLETKFTLPAAFIPE